MVKTPLFVDHPNGSGGAGVWRTIQWFPSSTNTKYEICRCGIIQKEGNWLLPDALEWRPDCQKFIVWDGRLVPYFKIEQPE
jgi:hypothetical protein